MYFILNIFIESKCGLYITFIIAEHSNAVFLTNLEGGIYHILGKLYSEQKYKPIFHELK